MQPSSNTRFALQTVANTLRWLLKGGDIVLRWRAGRSERQIKIKGDEISEERKVSFSGSCVVQDGKQNR